MSYLDDVLFLFSLLLAFSTSSTSMPSMPESKSLHTTWVMLGGVGDLGPGVGDLEHSLEARAEEDEVSIRMEACKARGKRRDEDNSLKSSMIDPNYRG